MREGGVYTILKCLSLLKCIHSIILGLLELVVDVVPLSQSAPVFYLIINKSSIILPFVMEFLAVRLLCAEERLHMHL